MSTAVLSPAPTAPDVALDPDTYRKAARDHGATAALTLLHADTGPGMLPVGPAGHVLLPRTVAESCDSAASGLPGVLGAPELVWFRVTGTDHAQGCAYPPGWLTGIAWIRLGLAERLLAQAAEHLRGREVQGTTTLNLPMVRAIVADTACGIAEARALLHGGSSPTAAHRALDDAGRHCLRLFGAWGFLTQGPGSEARVLELLGDAYSPALPPAPAPPDLPEEP